MYKLDLHTHSIASPDGGLTLADYRTVLEKGVLDYIAITDHDTIDFAQEARRELGERIIIGQEITTTEGEIIGLYLRVAVQAGLPAGETAAAIREQNGLVYIPHPFETVRKGVSADVLDNIAKHVDIIETHNGRAVFQKRGRRAKTWAALHRVPGAASSDAHGKRGWGRTYSVVSKPPTQANLPSLLRSATYGEQTVGIGIAYPKLNRIRRRHHAA